ncbi:MAG TPA: 5'-nucleotidase [Armatimonadota bacterium]|nr:5'-nucleotidase [Armatimonadota bacterium]
MRNTVATVIVLSLAVGLLSAIAADAAKTDTPLATEGIRQREVPLGNLVADALKTAGNADAAFVSAAQFSSGAVEPGKVTAADVSALLVKPTRVWVVSNFSGATIRAALERSLARAPTAASAHFLQVAGIKVQYDPDGAPGTRITSLTVKGAAVQANTMYKVALPEDLAKGGSGYFTVPGFNEGAIIEGVSGTMASAIGDFLGANASINYAPLNRIAPK